ncbi:MAG: hypothetical protein M0024_14070 [Nitrospiraceae bacterium]|nr:hypothetical protein [Nitrospiraceae bacterium]
MKKTVVVMGLAVLLALTGLPARSDAGISVGVNIGIPAYEFQEPPPLVVIPGTYAYFVPGIDLDILFYNGYWYRPYEGRWFRSRAYNGPWNHIGPRYVPRPLIGLPHDYRNLYGDRKHIPYGEFHRNWRAWERNKYWERDEGWRDRRHDGRDGHRGGPGDRDGRPGDHGGRPGDRGDHR